MAKTSDTAVPQIVIDQTSLADLITKAVGNSQGVTMSPEQMLEMFNKVIRNVERPENRNPPPSAWNGFGEQDFPKLRYSRVFFCGVPLSPRDLTRKEITALNDIRTPGQYGPDRTWLVKVVNPDTPDEELHIAIRGVSQVEGRLALPPLASLASAIVEEQDGQ